RGEERWLKLGHPAFDKPGMGVPDGWLARVGDTRPFALETHVVWVNAAEVRTAMNQAHSLSIELPRGNALIPLVRVETTPPTALGGAVSLRSGELPLQGQAARWGGKVVFQKKDLPPALREDPRLLSRLFSAPEARALDQRLITEPNQPIDYTLRRPVDL